MIYQITKMEEGYLMAVIEDPLEENKMVRESKSYAVSTLQELLDKIKAFETGEQ